MGALSDKLDQALAAPTLADQLDQTFAAQDDVGQPFLGAPQPGVLAGDPPPHKGPVAKMWAAVKRIGAEIAEPWQGIKTFPTPQSLIDAALGTSALTDFGLLPLQTRMQRVIAGMGEVQDQLGLGQQDAVPGLGEQAVTILTAIGASFKSLADGFVQTLIELGVEKGDARRTMRDLIALADTVGFGTGMAPSAAVLAKGREVRRAATGAEKRDLRFAALMKEREAMLQQRAENTADLAARKQARRTAPVLASRQQVQALEDIAAARARTTTRQAQDDITADALQTDARVHDPDNLLMDIPAFTQDVLTVPAVRKALATAEAGLRSRGLIPQGTATSPETVTKIAIDALASGGLRGSDLAQDLAEAGVSQKDFLMMLGATSTEAGRTLREFRTFRDHLRTQALRGDKGAQEMLQEMSDLAVAEADRVARGLPPGITPGEAAEPFLLQSGRLFRKLLVSLPSTAVRNFIEGFGTRTILQTANRALDTTLKRIFRPSDPLIEPVNAFDEWFRVLLPGNRRATREYMDRIFSAFPDVRHKLWSTLEADISMSKARASGRFLDRVEAGVDRYLLALNRAQSRLVRGPIFAAQLDRNLRRLGVSLEDVVDYGKVPAGMEKAMADAMDLALYTDYTITPKKGPMAQLMQGYAKIVDNIPGGFLFEPFPRFLYNAMKLVVEQMPTAGLRLIRPEDRARIAAGDYSVLARELTGAAMLATAFSIRKGQVPGITPGERWDEVKTEDGTIISLAPYVVFAAPLFLADLAIRAEEGRLPVSFDDQVFKQLREGLLGQAPQIEQGSSAIQAAISSLLEIDQLKDPQRFFEFFSEQASAGFLRPFQLIRDFGAEWDETWLIHRETRGQGIWAPAQEIFAPNQLPPRYLPTRSNPAAIPLVPVPFSVGEGGKISGNIARHVTGTLWRERRNAIENELALQGFQPRDLSPRTGDPFLDNMVARYQGPLLESIGELIVQSPAYLDLGVNTKREVLRQLVIGTREKALDAVKADAPNAALLRSLRQMPGLQREAVFEMMDQLLGDRGEGLSIEGLSTQIINRLRDARQEEEERLMQPQPRQEAPTNEQ